MILYHRKSRNGFTTATAVPGVSEYIKFTCKWSARNTFHQLNRDEVAELAKEQSGLQPGHPAFLGTLQRAATTLWSGLDDDVKADYVQAAKDWTVEALPSDVQARQVVT